jgi:hypothetical protein
MPILVVILLIAVCITLRAGENIDVPAKIRAMNFDSVYVLSRDYPKSPLVIGYRRVTLPFTNHPGAPAGMFAPEMAVFLEESLLDTAGRKVIPHVTYSHSIQTAPTGDRSYIVWKPSFFSGGTAVFDKRDNSSSEDSYIVDIKTGTVSDSGSTREVGEEYLLIERRDKGKETAKRTNVFELNTGHTLFRWQDPFTLSLRTVWYRNGILRLIAQDISSKYRLLDLRKNPVVNYGFKSLGVNSWIFTNGQSPRQCRIPLDDDLYGTFIDPETGRFGPEGILKFDSARWWYCDGYQSGCISKMRLEGVECRHPINKVRQVLVRLELKDDANDRVKYKRDHWLNVNLNPGDVGATNEFLLDQQVWFEGGVSWSAEVLDYR